jgi:hypothetical protein
MAIRTALLPLALLIAGCGAANNLVRVTDPSMPHLVGEGTPVTVSWGDPALFSEIRQSPNRWQATQGDWVVELGDYFSERIARTLPAGQRVEVEILDIELAGSYIWWVTRKNDVRLLSDLYPPVFQIEYQHYGADGQLISEGERRLSDLAYLDGPQPLNTSDPLRFEKRLIDRWVYREFGRPVTSR